MRALARPDTAAESMSGPRSVLDHWIEKQDGDGKKSGTTRRESISVE